ncbi:MAG TPA: response regulator [Polyangiaceae bacterium]|nr:response regulator [Polyangiaceae bacterium]
MVATRGAASGSRCTTLLVVSGGRLWTRVASLRRSNGWKLDHARDGREALQRIEATPPALLMANAKLPTPGPSGFDLCGKLRAQSPSSCSILVLVHASTEARLQAFRAHADDCVEEQLDARELSARANALAWRCDLPLPFAEPNDVALPASRPSALVHRRAAILARRYGLSPKQEQIVALVGSGVGLKDVGTACGCLDSTVRTHLRRIGEKLECAGTREILIRLFSVEA